MVSKLLGRIWSWPSLWALKYRTWRLERKRERIWQRAMRLELQLSDRKEWEMAVRRAQKHGGASLYLRLRAKLEAPNKS